MTGLIRVTNGIFTNKNSFKLQDIEKLKQQANGIIEEYIPYKVFGAPIGEFLASRDRVGSFLVKAPTMEELKEKIKTAVNTLKVFDVDGNDVMKREIWEFDN